MVWTYPRVKLPESESEKCLFTLWCPFLYCSYSVEEFKKSTSAGHFFLFLAGPRCKPFKKVKLKKEKKRTDLSAQDKSMWVLLIQLRVFIWLMKTWGRKKWVRVTAGCTKAKLQKKHRSFLIKKSVWKKERGEKNQHPIIWNERMLSETWEYSRVERREGMVQAKLLYLARM